MAMVLSQANGVGSTDVSWASIHASVREAVTVLVHWTILVLQTVDLLTTSLERISLEETLWANTLSNVVPGNANSSWSTGQEFAGRLTGPLSLAEVARLVLSAISIRRALINPGWGTALEALCISNISFLALALSSLGIDALGSYWARDGAANVNALFVSKLLLSTDLS